MGEAFKRKLVYGVALTISSFVSLFIADVKCKAHLKTKFKCIYVTMCSLVMSPFSCDFIKTEIDYN